jgi:ACS family tartrate transporter-like MFS transporter
MAKDHYRSAIRKAAIRLLPFLALCYAVNFLDRVNVGFAALTMNKDLGFGPETYGFGAGIFFAGSRCQAISRCNISAPASGSRGS